MTQGVPLTMVSYGIGVLLLIKQLKPSYPCVAHPWYDDNDRARGALDNLESCFNLLKHYVPAWGYYPDPTKSIMIVHPNNLKAGRLFGLCHGFKVYTGVSYLGSYIGDDKSKGDWIQKWTEKCKRNIRAVTATAEKYHRESYAAVA